LNIVAFSDYRVQDIDTLVDFIKGFVYKPDLILYAGDDIGRFVKRDGGSGKIVANRFEEFAALSRYGLCAVIGNDDSYAAKECIMGKNVYDVHKDPFIVEDFAIIGVEGAIYAPDESENGIGFSLISEKQAKDHIDRMMRRINKRLQIVILSHTPPRNTLDLALRFGQRHIGSKTLRKFVESNSKRIPLVVCGHVHLQGGKSERIKKTTVVNAASHDHEGAKGNVALIQLAHDEAYVEWRELGYRFNLYGVGGVKAAKFHAAGINTVEEILTFTPEELAQRVRCGIKTARSYHLRAKSVVENKVMVLQPLIALDENPIFLDIETDLTQSLVWLIGVYYAKEDRFVKYFAESPKDEKQILKRFLRDMKAVKGTIYMYSGTRFDERVLKKRMAMNGLDYLELPRFHDICSEIRRAVIFPVQSYALKDVAKYFGYRYRHQDLDGMTVAMEYMITYQTSRDKKLLKKLLEYNEDDVNSLPAIVEQVAKLAGTEVRVIETIEKTIDVQVQIPSNKGGQLDIIRKHYQQCGTFRYRTKGHELRFRTKDPHELAEIKAAMSSLGFSAGSYQEWDGKGYLPFYGKDLFSLVQELERR
jgi:uncharacterized protein YprB with RNaseH-like and TPR domain